MGTGTHCRFIVNFGAIFERSSSQSLFLLLLSPSDFFLIISSLKGHKSFWPPQPPQKDHNRSKWVKWIKKINMDHKGSKWIKMNQMGQMDLNGSKWIKWIKMD